MQKTAFTNRILLSALAAIIFSCSDGFPPEFPAPDFALRSPLSDEEVSLQSIKGRPTMIYWFASW